MTSRDAEVAVPVGHCVVFGAERGSGSSSLPRSLHGLGPLPARPPRYFRVLRPRLTSRTAEAERSCQSCRPSWSLTSPSELSPLCRNSSQLPKKPRAPPLLGFALFSPLYRSTFGASTPGSRGFLRLDGATRRVSFRPRGFSPPRRFPPHLGCEFVAPRCRLWGSARFLLPASRNARRLPGGPSHSPRRVSYPSKSSPHQQPYRITAAVALVSFLPALLARTSLDRSRAVWPVAGSRSFRVVARRRRGPRPPLARHTAAGRSLRWCAHLRRPRPSLVPCGSAGRGRWFRAVPPWPEPGQLGLRPPEEGRDLVRTDGRPRSPVEPRGAR
jgi:hypothetical protein